MRDTVRQNPEYQRLSRESKALQAKLTAQLQSIQAFAFADCKADALAMAEEYVDTMFEWASVKRDMQIVVADNIIELSGILKHF